MLSFTNTVNSRFNDVPGHPKMNCLIENIVKLRILSG